MVLAGTVGAHGPDFGGQAFCGLSSHEIDDFPEVGHDLAAAVVPGDLSEGVRRHTLFGRKTCDEQGTPAGVDKCLALVVGQAYLALYNGDGDRVLVLHCGVENSAEQMDVTGRRRDLSDLAASAAAVELAVGKGCAGGVRAESKLRVGVECELAAALCDEGDTATLPSSHDRSGSEDVANLE
jgi:hypothetical protein